MSTIDVGMKHFDGVTGWFSREDYKVIEPHVRPAKRVVEIGAYQGRSSLFIACTVEECGGQAELWTIDPHVPVDGKKWSGSDRAECYHNWGQYRRYSQHIRFLPLAAEEAAHLFEDRPIDVLFIDGNHKEAAEDLYCWRPYVRRGGIIAFHDKQMKPVQEAIRAGTEKGLIKKIGEGGMTAVCEVI